MTIAVLLVIVNLITVWGCQDLVPHDTQSLLIPSFRRSEILGFVAGFRTTFAALPDFFGDVQTSVKCGDEPKNDGNPWHLSDPLGLLRLANCFAAGDRMEYSRGVGQFP